MNKTYVIAALLIFLLIAGIVYYEKTRDKYKVEKLHWTDVMANISSANMTHRLLNHFSSGAQSYYHGNFSRVLDFVREHIYYERGEFPRSEDPEIILWRAYPQKGPARCGEFTIAYTALSIAFGIPSRMVVLFGQDHMWSEVYSEGQWIHVEPSDGIINDPLMYVRDRGKIIDADHPVLAFEADGSIVDVSERYK